MRTSIAVISIGLAVVCAVACGDDDDGAKPGASGGTSSGGASGSSGSGTSGANGGTSGANGGTSGSGGTSSGATPPTPPEKVQSGPAAGWADGHADVPAAGKAEDVSKPTTVIGTGTADSCKGADFINAVKQGGIITFNCGADPVTITLDSVANISNNPPKGPKIVIDGGNKVTLSGGGKNRILHMASCDKSQGGYPPGPGNCNEAAAVSLVVQNLTFVDGNAKNIADTDNAGGGGAIYAQGGSLKVVHSRFFNNVCADLGSDVGGGAIRKLDYLPDLGVGPARPVWIVDSTFGGADGYGNACANGGALSSIGVSWNILNSVLSNNKAVGHGKNDGDGGNGGAIYNDGNEIVMQVTSSYLHDNVANEGGSAIFFVSNNQTGTITVTNSKFERNPRGTFETDFGLYVKAKGKLNNVNSQILR